MMIKNKKQNCFITGVLVVLLVSLGCENKSAGNKLQLNNGSKWEANTETTEGIINMMGLLRNWQEENTTGDVVLLKSNLEAEYKLIFQRCTMKGPGHDQLHNYLIPLKEKIECVGSGDAGQLNSCIVDLEDHLQMYYEFFI